MFSVLMQRDKFLSSLAWFTRDVRLNGLSSDDAKAVIMHLLRV